MLLERTCSVRWNFSFFYHLSFDPNGEDENGLKRFTRHGDHILETADGIDNHNSFIIALIIGEYFKICKFQLTN